MKSLIIILIIFGIIFSRDIYFLTKKFLKLVDERLFFLTGLIKRAYENFSKTFGKILGNIFNYLDNKFKFTKFFFLLGRLLDKIWNFDKYLTENHFDQGLAGLLIFFPFLVIKLIASFFLFSALLFVSVSPIYFIVYLLNKFTPQPIASFIDYFQYLILKTFGNNIFGVLVIFIVFCTVLIIFQIIISVLFKRYFGSEKKTKKKRAKKRKSN
tara:strand:+ start:154 stop:789 length:636 start_codon:yes stop_codon:yes gene_type:complete